MAETDNVISINDFDANELVFSDEVDDKKMGIGYGDLPPLTQREDGKRLLQTDYLEVTTGWIDCYGLFPTYKLNKQGNRYVKTDEINGYQVICPLTSQETVHNPTEEEQTTINFFESFENKLFEYICENKENLPKNYMYLPDDEIKSILYPMVTRSKKEVETTDKKSGKTIKIKVPDPDKPLHLYLPVQYYQKNDKIFTNFRGPGDRLVDAKKYQKVRGQIEMNIRFEYVYFSDKISIKMRLVEANYRPQTPTTFKRRLGPNTAPIEEDIPDVQHDVQQQQKATSSNKNIPEPSPSWGDDDVNDIKAEPRRKPTKMIKNKKNGKDVECELVDGKWRPVKK